MGRYLDITKSIPVTPKVSYWDLHNLDYADELICKNGRTLLWALISGPTRVQCYPNVYSSYVAFLVCGPVTDDARHAPVNNGGPPDSYRLRLRYKLTTAEMEREKWTGAEKRTLARAITEHVPQNTAALAIRALGLG